MMFCNNTTLYVSLKLIYDKKYVFRVLTCEKNERIDMNMTLYGIVPFSSDLW